MPLYSELGRHTPPPPPYSLSQRKSNNTITTSEAPPQLDLPPPPPPLLRCTREEECTVPSTYELKQTVVLGGPFPRHNTVAIPAAPMSFQVAAVETLESGKCFGNYPRNSYCESIRFGIPVEPELIPGSHEHPLRPFDGLPLASRSQSLPHQSNRYDQRAGIRSRHDIPASKPPQTTSLGHSITAYPTQLPPKILAADNQQPLPSLRRHSSTNIPSLASPTRLNSSSSFGLSETMHPWSTLPSPHNTERRTTLTTSTTTTQPKAHHHLHHHCPSPARLVLPSNDRTSQAYEKWRHVPQTSNRRPSASMRFEPYKRRQPRVVDSTEQMGLGVEADKDRIKLSKVDRDVDTEGRGEEDEGERRG